jgi:eukaryotic-like serine/threonine-protein kinase
MALASGTKLGPYEIVAPLGAGGMGEVYRAKDTRLGREVAVKVLQQHLSNNPDLKQRFDREGKAISSLSHPHICALFDIGHQDETDYLVMELLEGETLEQRLRKGPLPTKQLLEVGVQVAEALDRAHRSGIIHRDLKPGNIMLTKSGAKLMDFGLAKPPVALATAASGDSPTIPAVSKPLTAEGSIVGTYQYMSPEQLEGKEADARSDIFAFGAVLYEMATAQRAFGGKSAISVMSAILEKEPESISKLNPLSPPVLEHVIGRALAKEPERRWQSARDVAEELKWISGGGSQVASAVAIPHTHGRNRGYLAGAAVLMLALLAVLGWILRGNKPAPEPVVAYMLPPAKSSFVVSYDDESGPMVVSPDGTKVAFVARAQSGSTQIWIRALSDNEAKPVAGTEHGSYPFWSPDGKSIGFFGAGSMRRVNVAGGPITDICPVVRPRGGSWSADGIILFAPDTGNAIFKVSVAPGSTPEQVTAMAPENTTHRWPAFLPDGKHFIFLGTNHSDPGPNAHNGIYFASLGSNESRLIVPAESNALYANGHLLWMQNGSILAQPFDPAAGKLSGEPTPLFDNVFRSESTWRANFDANDSGVLVYHEGSFERNIQLQWMDRTGKVIETLPDSAKVTDVRISPDGRKAALLIGAGPALNAWVVDRDSGTRTRLTFERTTDGLSWSPDSKQLYFGVVRGKDVQICRKPVSGDGEEVIPTPTNLNKHVVDVSPDGKYLLFEQPYEKLPSTTWVLKVGSNEKPRPLLQEMAAAHGARFSPDGRWIVYVAVDSGLNQLFATSLEHGGKKQLVTTSGWGPRWRSDSKAIYYTTQGHVVMELPVTSTPTSLEVGKPVELFKTINRGSSFWTSTVDATPDGKQFAVISMGEEADLPGTLVLNWTAKLKK